MPMMRPALAVAALIVATAGGSARAQADPFVTPEYGATLHGSLDLSLANAIAMGIENNLDVEVERYAPLIADENYQISWGAYDPILSGEGGYDERTQPRGISNPLVPASGQKSTGADGSAALSGILPYLGGDYEVSFIGDLTRSNSIISSFNPQYGSNLTFRGSLPLLRGLVWNQSWTGIKTSAVLQGETSENFRASVMTIVQLIETNYWNLIAEREQLSVAHKSLETANALLDQVQTQYEVGVVSKVEVVEAEAGVAEREFSLIVAENQYRTAQDDLIDVVLGPHLTAGSTLEVQPSEAPEAYTVYEVDVPKAVDVAFASRPELRAAEYELERSELELRFRQNERLPQLDVRGGYGVNGLSGQDPAGGPNAPAGQRFHSSAGSLFGGLDGDAWDVRAVVSVPLGNISGRHGVSKAELELRRADVRLKRTRQQIILEVRKSARDLMSGLEGIEAAERRRLAAEEQLRAEKVRLEHGESTPFEVLQRESDLVDAESQKINALQTYRNSEAALLRAQGTILSARNVVFEDVAPLR